MMVRGLWDVPDELGGLLVEEHAEGTYGDVLDAD